MKNTLYSDQLDSILMKDANTLSLPDPNSLLAKDYFYITNFKYAKRYFLFFFELYENIIVVRKSEKEPVVAYMDIKNCFMRVTTKPWKDNNKIIGIKFLKKKVFEEIFNEDKSIVKKWFELLKKHCILIKFRNYFDDISVLGNGNFAKVYLVKKKTTQEKKAVKVFDKNLFMCEKSEKDCILNEIEILRNISHENLLQLKEIYEGENHVYCVCEYYKGYNLLENLIKNGMPNLSESLFIIQQILMGVDYLANKNIIHRDIKPENILICDFNNDVSDKNLIQEKYLETSEVHENGEFVQKDYYTPKKKSLENSFSIFSKKVVLVDFGFSTFEKDYKKLFTRCGTPGFVAPEILEDKVYDKKVDIYSVGIIFFLLLTGDIPFDSESYRDMVYLNTQGHIDFEIIEKMGVPDTIAFLIKKMLEKNPEERYSAKECLDYLESIFNEDNEETKNINDSKVVLFFQDKERENRKNKQNMPNRTRDLSPNIQSDQESNIDGF